MCVVRFLCLYRSWLFRIVLAVLSYVCFVTYCSYKNPTKSPNPIILSLTTDIFLSDIFLFLLIEKLPAVHNDGRIDV